MKLIKLQYRFKTLIIYVLVCIIFLNLFSLININTIYGIEKTLTITQARQLSLYNNSDYRETKNDITLLNIKYEQAVKSIALKKHNMSTFRWTPLLSFKFPEKANLVEEYEFTYKPLQIQSDIKVKQHELSDIVYQIYEETELLYVKIYGLQEKINFNNQRIKSLKNNFEKNKARVIAGKGLQEDVDKIKSSLDKLETDTSILMRNFETEKNNLGEMIQIDVTTGYTFSNPLLKTQLERNQLNALINRTLNMNQEYYETKLNTSLALTTLNTYESLMKKQYGSKMMLIQSYINMAKKNQSIHYDSFKLKYDELQKEVDSPWKGKKRILFIRIPREWFKGQISGIRYIEDEPYALITAAKEYTSAVNEENSIKKSIEKEVKSSFENIITAYNAYSSLEKNVNSLKKDYEKNLTKNKLGQVVFEEVKMVQEEYEEAQMDALDSLVAYTELLYTYNRLTCGGINAIISNDISLDIVEGGDSIIIDKGDEGATYTIQSQIEDNLFLFSVSIPGDFEPNITHYELWVNDIQIGTRTSIDDHIRHLTLDLENVESIFVRFYSDDEFVDDCIIDESVYHGNLEIKNGYLVNSPSEILIGTYECKETSDGMVEFKVFTEYTDIASYRLVTDDGKSILNNQFIPISKQFKYLLVLKDSFENMQINLYGSNEELLYKGRFDTSKQRILITANES